MQRLRPLDVSFLHLERDVQQLNVGSVLVFEGPAPSIAEVTGAIERLLPAFPRYRQRVRGVPLDLGLPVWLDDPQFRLVDHVGHRVLPPPGTDDMLRRLSVQLISRPLDLDHPLWRTWLVTGLHGGRFALVNTNHHAMIDGVSGTDIIGVLLTPTGTSTVPARGPVVQGPWTPEPQPTTVRLALDAVLGLAANVADGAARLGRALRPNAIRQSGKEAVGIVHFGAQLAHIELGLNGPLGPRRDWCWAGADLDDVKAVKNRHGGTVNDVVLAAVAGGFRTLLLSRGQDVDGHTLRAMVPVSTRPADDHRSLGNRVSAVFADLPVGLADPLARLHAVSTQMRALKSSGTALGADTLLGAADLLPGSLFALGAKAWAHTPQRIFSTVVTNLPGPRAPRYLLGRRMTDLYPYIPLGADLRITIGVVSYSGRLALGVTGDHDSVPDLPVLARGIDEAIAELIALSTPSTGSEVRHAREG